MVVVIIEIIKTNTIKDIDKKNIVNYVCPHCFNNVKKCTCEFYPLYLIHIDKMIQKHIKILNDKGYKTKFCCASHNDRLDIYISFFDNYLINNKLLLPKHFIYDKKRMTIYCNYNNYKRIENEDLKDIENKRKQLLKDLLLFCRQLEKNK